MRVCVGGGEEEEAWFILGSNPLGCASLGLGAARVRARGSLAGRPLHYSRLPSGPGRTACNSLRAGGLRDSPAGLIFGWREWG